MITTDQRQDPFCMINEALESLPKKPPHTTLADETLLDDQKNWKKISETNYQTVYKKDGARMTVAKPGYNTLSCHPLLYDATNNTHAIHNQSTDYITK